LVQILGANKIKSAAGPCKGTQYKGETCLMPSQGKYPVTDGGKLSPERVKAALVYGSKMNVLGTLKANGLCTYVKKVGIDNSTVCK
jgi:hypothetical protein